MITDSWMVYSILALVCAAGMIITLGGEYFRRVPFAFTGKLIAATAYLAAALSLGAGYSAYGRYLLAAMLCCWVGDLLLVSRKSKGLFVAGLFSFLLGHVVYAGAFLSRGISVPALLVSTLVMAVFAARIAHWLKPSLDRRMILPVNVYILAISTMAVMAAASFHLLGGWPLLAGAVLFVVSDLAVARHRFVAPGLVNRAWGLPVYFTAQFLLAATVIY